MDEYSFYKSNHIVCEMLNGRREHFEGDLFIYRFEDEDFIIGNKVLFESSKDGNIHSWNSNFDEITDEEKSRVHSIVVLYVFHTRGYGDSYGKALLARKYTDEALHKRVVDLCKKVGLGEQQKGITGTKLKRLVRKIKDKNLTLMKNKSMKKYDNE